ncbi:MAG: anthranilate synthase component, partial [Actinomycetota bacterium]|nr:anthranilate synthase component [Actinomycetota bacterium]
MTDPAQPPTDHTDTDHTDPAGTGIDPAAVSPDLRPGTTWPSLGEFRALASDRRVVPVVRRFLADGLT